MQTSVSLQGPFSYSLLIFFILMALVIVPPILYLIFRLRKRTKAKKVVERPVVKKPRYDIPTLKKKYLGFIDKIEKQRIDKEIDDREAYLQLSSCVRGFVEDATGISARNMTLSDIEMLNMPQLTSLIEKFYDPEFSPDADDANPVSDFADARMVVSSWN